MAIRTGEQIPEGHLWTVTGDELETVSTRELFDGKTVVLFGVPGAFTPTCSRGHLPGFVAQAETIKAKGVDTIACMSVNDPFVMQAWGEHREVGDEVLMLSDGNGEFTSALGLENDESAFGMGRRCKRFAMIVRDGEVTVLNVEADGVNFEISRVENILSEL